MSQNNEKNKDEQKPKVELENTAENLNKEVKRLEKLCNVFRDTIDRLEDENTDLREELAKLKESEGAPEESIGTVQKLIQARHAAMESKEEIGEGETGKMKKMPEIKSGSVSELIKRRHSEMEGQEGTQSSQKPIEKTVIEHEIETVAQPEPTEIKSESPPIPEEPKISVIETSESRRVCPNCGNQNLRLIREVTDKTRLISPYPRLYGKKFKCGECGAEWR
jgi:hypothetical protein